MSVLCVAESFTRLACVINTTFREKIYIRWCCIDPLSWQGFQDYTVRPRRAGILGAKRTRQKKSPAFSSIDTTMTGQSKKIVLLPGDGIGPEIVRVAVSG